MSLQMGLRKLRKNNSILTIMSKLFRIRQYRHAGEWAYFNRVLPPENAEPGKFKYWRTPYFIPVYEALCNSKYRIIGLMCASQMAKSELGFNFVGHRMDTKAQPAMILLPTKNLAEKISQTRFQKLIESSESLNLKHKKGQRDKITLKIIGGAPLHFSYCSSANQMCSDAVATVYIDEYDRTPDDVDGEGEPLEIILARVTTYPNAKTFVTSTPKLIKTSKTNKLFLQGFRAYIHVLCPECSNWLKLCFDIFKWDDDDPNKVTRAWIECTSCHFQMGDEYKDYFNEIEEVNGTYKAKNAKFFSYDENGDRIDPFTIDTDIATFFVSGLLSPWRSMLECAKRWLIAVESGEETRKQSVMNTVFGEPYESEGNAPDYTEVHQCKLGYLCGELHIRFSEVIIMSVDVQKDCLYYVIRGWNSSGNSALIDYGVIYGNTNESDVWKKLYKESLRSWGNNVINYCFIDCGYRPHYVYAFCKEYGTTKYIPVQGKAKQSEPVRCVSVEVTFRGKRFQRGIKKFNIHDSYFKSMLYGRIRRADIWFVPSDVSDEYCRQVTAETLVLDGINEEWKEKYKHNHYLDCEKMQLFASYVMRIDLVSGMEKKEFEETLSEEDLIEGEIKEVEETIEGKNLADVIKENEEEKFELRRNNPTKIIHDKGKVGVNVWGKR